MVRTFVVGLLLVVGGCAARIDMASQPIGAVMTLEDGAQVVTPATIDTVVWPAKRKQGVVSASGYRSLHVRIPYASQRTWMIVLVPEHGPAGSWDDSDLP